MPKQRITKKMIVDAAFEIARNSGMEQVMVKNIADKMKCSVQPIYSYCKNMDGLREAVIEQTNLFIQEYIAAHMNKKDIFRSTGRAYIQLSQEEPHLFRIFILHQRRGISSLNDLYHSETNPQIAKFIGEQLGISQEQARQLHMNMLIYTIGLGTVFSVTTPGIPTDEIYLQLENAYEAFLEQSMKKVNKSQINREGRS